MENIVKIGYVRKETSSGTSYINMKEFYTYSDAMRLALKQSVDNGSVALYCACSAEKDLPLNITKDLVIRVAQNGQRERHKSSCPKSTEYASYSANNTENGIYYTEDSQMILNLALPSVFPNSSSSSSSSEKKETDSQTKTHRTNPLNISIILNKTAWLKQTYSIRKQIGIAHKEGRKPSWQYKDLPTFFRLIFGISNDIYAYVRGENIPFINLCYKPSLFYDNENYDCKKQWYICAEVFKISDIKPDRKYQYVTLNMPGKCGAAKVAVRIETEYFHTIYGGFENYPDNMHLILCGWVARKYFPAQNDKAESDWMQLLKGNFFFVNSNGLYAENEAVAAVADTLCKRKVIFTRPDIPYESYGNLVPTFCIPRHSKPDILIDVVPNSSQEKKRTAFAQATQEYEIHVLNQKGNYQSAISDIIDRLYSS